MKSLFDFATRELSQDAFLRWLFENYNAENQQVGRLALQLLSAFAGKELKRCEIADLATYAQWKKIDVTVCFSCGETDHVIAIEDKTTSQEHEQLAGYSRALEAYAAKQTQKGRRTEIHQIFYKTTALQAQERERVLAQGWKIFDLPVIEGMLRDYAETGSEILDGYIAHVRRSYLESADFTRIPFAEWHSLHVFHAYCTQVLSGRVPQGMEFFSEIYRGMYVYAIFRVPIAQGRMRLFLEFRDSALMARIDIQPQEGVDEITLRRRLRDAVLPTLQHFPKNPRANTLARLYLDRTDKACCLADYQSFDAWVQACLSDFERAARSPGVMMK